MFRYVDVVIRITSKTNLVIGYTHSCVIIESLDLLIDLINCDNYIIDNLLQD